MSRVRTPNGSSPPYSVIGEPYGKAVAILKSQGVRSSFGGSIGSDVPPGTVHRQRTEGHLRREDDPGAELHPEGV